MSEGTFDLIPLLDYIDPSTLSYQEWVNVGMALKQEGYTAMDWDAWSQSDSRYKLSHPLHSDCSDDSGRLRSPQGVSGAASSE